MRVITEIFTSNAPRSLSIPSKEEKKKLLKKRKFTLIKKLIKKHLSENKKKWSICWIIFFGTWSWNYGVGDILAAWEVGWGYKYCDLHFPQDAYDQPCLPCTIIKPNYMHQELYEERVLIRLFLLNLTRPRRSKLKEELKGLPWLWSSIFLLLYI